MNSITYITRKTNLTDLYASSEITLPEWMNFVANDPEMRLDNYTSVTLANGEGYRYLNPGAAVFLKRETGQSLIQEVVFDFIAGSVRVYNADQQTITKIKQIAFKLNAHIYQETNSYTVEIPQQSVHVKARFYFKDLFTPFKRLLLPLRFRLQHFFASLSRKRTSGVVVHSPEE